MNKVYKKQEMIMGVFLSLFLAVSTFVGLYAVKNFTLNTSQAKKIYLYDKAVELNYDQINPSFVEINQSQVLNARKDFTAEAWIKPSQPQVSSYIFSKGSGSENGFYLSVSSDIMSEDLYSVEFRFGVADANLTHHATRNIVMQYSFSEQEITSWHHVAGVIQSDGKMDIFVDGERSTMNFNSINNIWENTIPVAIGARQFDNGDADGYFPGLIDEVRISSISRYPDNFVVSNTPFSVDEYTNLLLHFNSNLFDSSGNNRDGLAVGSLRYVDSTIIPLTKVKPTKKPKDNVGYNN